MFPCYLGIKLELFFSERLIYIEKGSHLKDTKELNFVCPKTLKMGASNGNFGILMRI